MAAIKDNKMYSPAYQVIEFILQNLTKMKKLLFYSYLILDTLQNYPTQTEVCMRVLLLFILISSSTNLFASAIETCLDDNGFPASCQEGSRPAVLRYVSSIVYAGQAAAFAWAGGNEAFAEAVTIRAYKVADIDNFNWNQVSQYIRNMEATGQDVPVCVTPQITGTPIAVCNGVIPTPGSYIMRAQSARTINANFVLGIQTVK